VLSSCEPGGKVFIFAWPSFFERNVLKHSELNNGCHVGSSNRTYCNPAMAEANRTDARILTLTSASSLMPTAASAKSVGRRLLELETAIQRRRIGRMVSSQIVPG